MSIAVGDKVPSITLKRLTDAGLTEVATDDLFRGKKVVLFGVPGAFTPTCHKSHLPGYIARAGELKAKGIDDIVCMAVNDPFVMKAWGESAGAGDAVTLLPDGNGELSRALGLEMDGSGAGLGTRCKRFSMIVDDGVVKSLEVEANAGTVDVSGAGACLARL
ncbi:MAG TPA: peroxiredoxin [Kofleriaceae bacterium]|nr:peroxiredoxin [Kofleriaceae bacterium]